jgi:xanthine dehydrogenase accessory factor
LLGSQLAPGGWAVVATQGRRDLQGLKAALALQPRRTWFVASARKGAVLKESLIASGEDAARVNAIVAPAGAAIGPQTPEEIALSVLAAVVAARRAEVNDAVPAKSCCGGKKAAAPSEVVAPAMVAPAMVAPAMVAPAMVAPAKVEAAKAEPPAPVSGTLPASSSCCGS